MKFVALFIMVMLLAGCQIGPKAPTNLAIIPIQMPTNEELVREWAKKEHPTQTVTVKILGETTFKVERWVEVERDMLNKKIIRKKETAEIDAIYIKLVTDTSSAYYFIYIDRKNHSVDFHKKL